MNPLLQPFIEALDVPAPLIHQAVTQELQVMADINQPQNLRPYQVITITNEFGSQISYALGNLMSKTKYGVVVYATQVQPHPQHTHIAVSTNLFVAVKIYGLQTVVEAMHKGTRENPFREMSVMQIIGNNQAQLMGCILCAQTEACLYAIMRLNLGSLDLFEYLHKRSQVLSEATARIMMKQVFTGLQYLHAMGFVHLDISPENILVNTTADQFTIIDFGMCLRLLHPVHEPIAFRGKPSYCPPELYRGDLNVNPTACDIWSCGATLFTVLTGYPLVRTAVSSDRNFKMIQANRLLDLIQSTGAADHLSAEIRDLLYRMLRSSPGERISLAEIANHPWMTMINNNR